MAVASAAVALTAAVVWAASYWRIEHVAYGHRGGRISAANPRGYDLRATPGQCPECGKAVLA
jgi:hypothetical protein